MSDIPYNRESYSVYSDVSFEYNSIYNQAGRKYSAPEVHKIEKLSNPLPTLDRISVVSSRDVTIGNQTYISGTVVINNLITSGSVECLPQERNQTGSAVAVQIDAKNTGRKSELNKIRVK